MKRRSFLAAILAFLFGRQSTSTAGNVTLPLAPMLDVGKVRYGWVVTAESASDQEKAEILQAYLNAVRHDDLPPLLTLTDHLPCEKFPLRF